MSDAPRPLGEVLRDEMVARDRIEALLRESPRTIPELAEALGAPGREVVMWLMGMRRFGAVEEMPKAKADDYYRYRLRED